MCLLWRFKFRVPKKGKLLVVLNDDCVEIRRVKTVPTACGGEGILIYDERKGHD